jgi:hypothetical protein
MDRGAFTITGVVDPRGVGGSQAAGETEWSLGCVLSAWRDPEGVVRRLPLELHRRLSYEELDAWSNRLPIDAVVRLRVRFEDSGSALLVEILGGARDVDLERLAEERKTPRTFTSDPFGTFREDRRVGWFESSTTWGAAAVRLTVTPDEDGDVLPVLEVARSLWARQAAWEGRLREHLGALTDDAGRLTLQTVAVDPGGRWTFWYDDGGRCSGRAIFVGGRLERGPLEAGIIG